MPKRVETVDNLKNLLEVKNITETTADLYFYGDIVSSWWGAWDDTDQYPEAVKSFLESARGKNLNIHINSGGGSVFAGITIYNMLKGFEGYKTVYVDGIAASIASIIALAGDRVIMRTGSAMMVHQPLLCLCGGYNADDMRQMAEHLDKILECIMQVYKENAKSGIDIAEIEAKVKAETWMTNEEASCYFNVEVDEIQAVACESEYISKFLTEPPQYARGKVQNRDDIEIAKAKLKLLNMRGEN